MNRTPDFTRIMTWALGAVGLAMLPACANPFITRHKVLVDSIAAPGAVKPNAIAYRLLAKKSVINQVQAQVNVVKACVDAALSGYGMYEAPPNVAPELFIEVAYGVDTSGRVDPASRETFLQLSARANPERAVERGTGPELWDVRVAVLGVAGRIETAMPLLSAVAANYMATDTKIETKIEIPQNSPMIASVRENAIKALEQAAAGSAAAPAANQPAPPAQPPPAPPQANSGGATAGTAPAASK